MLVNNAGVMPPERTRSADGVELCFATHVLAPWVLIEQFAPLVTRVINVTSGGMYAQALNSGDLTSERDTYNPKRFYARTKRAEMVITEQWAERLEGTVVHAMHPGWVDTKGVQSCMPVFRTLTRPILRDLDAGADTDRVARRRARAARRPPASCGWTAAGGRRTTGSARRPTAPRTARSYGRCASG